MIDTDLQGHFGECDDQPDDKDCICDEVYFAKLDSEADNQMESMRGN